MIRLRSGFASGPGGGLFGEAIVPSILLIYILSYIMSMAWDGLSNHIFVTLIQIELRYIRVTHQDTQRGRLMQQARLGRPPSEGTTMGKAFMLRLPDDLQGQIDEVASSLPDRKERSAAIRMLLREALAARAGKSR